MKVHAFREDIGGDEDAVVVTGRLGVGVEVGNDGAAYSGLDAELKSSVFSSTSFLMRSAR
jgi:hypothetical protein